MITALHRRPEKIFSLSHSIGIHILPTIILYHTRVADLIWISLRMAGCVASLFTAGRSESSPTKQAHWDCDTHRVGSVSCFEQGHKSSCTKCFQGMKGLMKKISQQHLVICCGFLNF